MLADARLGPKERRLAAALEGASVVP